MSDDGFNPLGCGPEPMERRADDRTFVAGGVVPAGPAVGALFGETPSEFTSDLLPSYVAAVIYDKATRCRLGAVMALRPPTSSRPRLTNQQFQVSKAVHDVRLFIRRGGKL